VQNRQSRRIEVNYIHLFKNETLKTRGFYQAKKRTRSKVDEAGNR
jgi:hypothetical protein